MNTSVLVPPSQGPPLGGISMSSGMCLMPSKSIKESEGTSGIPRGKYGRMNKGRSMAEIDGRSSASLERVENGLSILY